MRDFAEQLLTTALCATTLLLGAAAGGCLSSTEVGDGSTPGSVLGDAGEPGPRADGGARAPPDAGRTPRDAGPATVDDGGDPADDAGRPASGDAGAATDAGAVPPHDAGVPHTDAGDPGPSTCPAIEPLPVVPESPLAEHRASGRRESVAAAGFTDEYLYDDEDYIKVGVRPAWGASIVFFGLASGGPGSNATNTIDANDPGREVQVAFYDERRVRQGCAHDASCAPPYACPDSIRFLGWNPVQGGNRCGAGSPSTIVDDEGVLKATITPLHWNPDWSAETCAANSCGTANEAPASDVRVTQRLRFVRRHIVELDYVVQNLSALDHVESLQELPTLYAANGEHGPDLWRVMRPDGTQVDVTTPGNDGFFYQPFNAGAPWVSLQNEDLTYGVALLYENGLQSFTAWQNRDLPFNNVRADMHFAIPAWGVVRARAYLLLGSLETNAADAAWLMQTIGPFGVLDEPATETASSTTVTVRGWALDNRGVTGVRARIDDSVDVDLSYGDARPDVCRVWPQYPGCDAVGFTGSVTLPADGCAHRLDVWARDGDGNERLVGTRRLAVAE